MPESVQVKEPPWGWMSIAIGVSCILLSIWNTVSTFVDVPSGIFVRPMRWYGLTVIFGFMGVIGLIFAIFEWQTHRRIKLVIAGSMISLLPYPVGMGIFHIFAAIKDLQLSP